MNQSQSNVQPSPARNNAETLIRYAVPPYAFNFVRNLEIICRILMSFSSVTLDVFIRREFGERHLNIGRILAGWLTLQIFMWIANLPTIFAWVPGIRPLASERTINRWFLICFLLLSCLHLLRIWQRNRAGIVWHSHSFGVSWLDFLTKLPPLRIGKLELSVTDWMLYRFIEPGLCLLIAWYFVPGPSFTRNWLIWCSLAMLIHNSMIFTMRRARFLDLLDSQIESGYYNTVRDEAIGVTSKYQTAGHVAMPLPPKPVLETMAQADLAATVRETLTGVAVDTKNGVEDSQSI